MKRARFTEEQIIGILRENDAGAKAGELARKHGVSEGTIYAWKAKFGGMSVSEAQRLKTLEASFLKARCRLLRPTAELAECVLERLVRGAKRTVTTAGLVDRFGSKAKGR
ncbi:transposase [Acuticoccus sp. MNP-M23]|nr:transposase [Acuticoccus sp. MNP-M23]WMS43454.1 transposase [Acuticoccus sp. MNP-M23]